MVLYSSDPFAHELTQQEQFSWHVGSQSSLVSVNCKSATSTKGLIDAITSDIIFIKNIVCRCQKVWCIILQPGYICQSRVHVEFISFSVVKYILHEAIKKILIYRWKVLWFLIVLMFPSHQICMWQSVMQAACWLTLLRSGLAAISKYMHWPHDWWNSLKCLRSVIFSQCSSWIKTNYEQQSWKEMD